MSRYFYDFHTHSCLSPCGDADMTPANLAGMAALAGLQIVALTDHNSARNCPAFFAAAEKYGIIPVAGMELTTSEDIHAVCLFERLEDALRFNDAVDGLRIRIRNREDIFGEQLLMDEEDRILGRETDLLPNATRISLEELPALTERYGGVSYPAHIDRTSNGILSILGAFPEELPFLCAEVHDSGQTEALCGQYPILRERQILFGSDAHFLWEIRDAEATVELHGLSVGKEPRADEIRAALFRRLRGEEK